LKYFGAVGNVRKTDLKAGLRIWIEFFWLIIGTSE
jgi:hypothetical protein